MRGQGVSALAAAGASPAPSAAPVVHPISETGNPSILSPVPFSNHRYVGQHCNCYVGNADSNFYSDDKATRKDAVRFFSNVHSDGFFLILSVDLFRLFCYHSNWSAIRRRISIFGVKTPSHLSSPRSVRDWMPAFGKVWGPGVH